MVLIIRKYYLYLLALLPLMSLKMTSISIILFVFISILNYKGKEEKSIFKLDFLKLTLIYSTPFFLYLVSLLWTSNLTNGISIIEKSLSFLVIPFTIFILRPFRSIRSIKRFYEVYILASAMAVLITGVYILLNINHILNSRSSYFANIKLRNYIKDTPIIGEHPIYFSLILVVAMILLYYNKFKNKWINLILFLLLFSGIIIASSRGVIFGGIAIIILMIYQRFKNIKKTLLISLLFLTCFTVVGYFSPLKTRVLEILNTKHIYPEGIHFNSFNIRMAIYNCSFELIKDSPIMGFGPGDTQEILNNCYRKFDTKAFDDINYNSHNQYLDYYLSFGVIGFILIVSLFVYYLKNAIKSRDYQYINFLVLFYVVFLIENVLVRNTGLVLFTLFNCLFVYSKLLEKE